MLKILKAVGLTVPFIMIAGLVGCSNQSRPAFEDVVNREIVFPEYPSSGWTYLSFSQAHGYQVNYLGKNGRAWLWYPGNSVVVAEEWKRDTVAGQKAVCWRHPAKSYNPVTKRYGGSFACQSLALSQRRIIARLKGDPFALSSDKIPYRLSKCSAPKEFDFNRDQFRC